MLMEEVERPVDVVSGEEAQVLVRARAVVAVVVPVAAVGGGGGPIVFAELHARLAATSLGE